MIDTIFKLACIIIFVPPALVIAYVVLGGIYDSIRKHGREKKEEKRKMEKMHEKPNTFEMKSHMAVSLEMAEQHVNNAREAIKSIGRMDITLEGKFSSVISDIRKLQNTVKSWEIDEKKTDI